MILCFTLILIQTSANKSTNICCISEQTDYKYNVEGVQISGCHLEIIDMKYMLYFQPNISKYIICVCNHFIYLFNPLPPHTDPRDAPNINWSLTLIWMIYAHIVEQQPNGIPFHLITATTSAVHTQVD